MRDAPPFADPAPEAMLQQPMPNDQSAVLANLCGWQVSLERFLWQGQPETVPRVTERGRLGQGSIGEVYEVKIRSFHSELTMARKSIAISRRKRIALRELDMIREEIVNMRNLSHAHVVQVLGCYQEGEGTRDHFFHVLMFPVGDRDLGTFLEDRYDAAEGSPHKTWLRSWFSCLASALAYMHSRKIHHEDIKPKNIIHRGERVMFTDFSSSRKFESGQETSTANPARASRLFAAPEALPTEDGTILRHGSKTDIFSLGLVFVEMLTVLCGRAIDDLHDGIHTAFPGFDDNWERRQYYRVVAYFSPWFASTSGSLTYDMVIQPMLVEDRKDRASADAVLALLSQQLPICRCTGVTAFPYHPSCT
ncbi:kinase-like protein [Lophiostoma macrostomum CBS 122681]|uniref:Kinase-like protein n=1 Tax=Lophiostoma macrostomum CBS 122681 TaxID=1314788 RepID=A0A6A6TB11_9PLEO|nr:kinase-like protein [Lophiostoma macrostomum CBS 122681]